MEPALARGHPAGINHTAGRLAQLVERLLYTQDVGGSSPSPPTSFRAGRFSAKTAARAKFGSGLGERLWRARHGGTIQPDDLRTDDGGRTKCPAFAVENVRENGEWQEAPLLVPIKSPLARFAPGRYLAAWEGVLGDCPKHRLGGVRDSTRRNRQ
jgi:hypothetical protein